MIEIEYIEAVEKVFSLISFKDIKKFLGIKKTHALEIWGNYNAFEKSLLNPRSEMCMLRNMYASNSKYNYERLEYINAYIYLVGKLGYWRSFWKRLIAIKTFCKYRNDLNIFTRLYLLIVKLTRSSRWVMQIELKEYWNNVEYHNEIIKSLFEDNKITRLYLYKYKKELE